MATRLTHRQRPDLQSYTIIALGRAFAVTGQAASTLAGRRLTVPDRIPYSYDGYAATLTTGTGDVWNVTPAPSWSQGVSNPYDLTATLPSTYTDGGVYSFGYEGTTPPTGLTLSEAGSLDVGTATAATTTGVKFSYYEPGATTTLTLHSQFAGTYPYMATIYPLEGTVPSGQILLSPDDSTFRSSVLSTWPDGSAQVMVGAGRKAVSGGGTTNIKLRPGLASGTNMTTTDLVAVVNTVAVNFGTPLSLTLTNSNHDRIWWQNPEVICARYRLPITNKGSMEAVIDVHCFQGGRAFVEVVIENSKMVSGSPSKPADQTYTAATVSVNGTVINGSGTNSSHTIYPNNVPTAQPVHEAFRAWYCSGWVGGDPGIEVTHDTVSLQAHPAFNKIAVASSVDLQTTYGSDAYEPWTTERQRAYNMGGTGDGDGTIGPLQKWDYQYLQTGSRYARRAVIANNLAALSYNVNYRDTNTSEVPTYTQLASKSRQSNWPETTTEPEWEVAHHPAMGLVGFLCRPSPCFIEIAQKVAQHNATFEGSGAGAGFGYWYQTRGKAWSWRSLWHSIFVTPDTHSWKAPAQAAVDTNITLLNGYRIGSNPLGLIWDYSPTSGFDHGTAGTFTGGGFQQSIWQHYFLAGEIHRAHFCKVVSGTSLTSLGSLADWAVGTIIRYVTEATAGEYRVHRYKTTIGTNELNGATGAAPVQLSTWDSMLDWYMTDAPPAESGPWIVAPSGGGTEYAGAGYVTNNVAWTQENYVVNFWGAFVCAVERDIAGASSAWSRVTAGVTNLGTPSLPGTWLTGFQTYPTNGFWPRNK